MPDASFSEQRTLSADQAARIQALCSQFHQTRDAGQWPRIEDYLEKVAEANERLPLLKDLVDLEIALRRADGEPVAVEEYWARFPELDKRWLDGLITAAGSLRPHDPLNGPPLTGHAKRIRCPHCHNPINLVDDKSDEVLCPGCGSSFTVRDARHTDTTARSKPLGKYQLLERVGLGAFGAVWKARDTELDRIVALKIPHSGLLTEDAELERFKREARAAAQLRHPGIVTVYDVETLEGLPTIVSDFIAGAPMRDLLQTRKLTFREAAIVMADVADAVHYAHTMNVVHRDLKPANILMSFSRERQASADADPALAEGSRLNEMTPLIADFGLALRNEAEVTMTMDGHIIGTPAYMSPEQAAGKGHAADARSDVYSLGVIFYELLTGELPFRGSRVMKLSQVMHEEPRPPRKLKDKIPRDLETVCLKCLRKEPGRRYQTARELAEDLRRWLNGEPVQARPVGKLERGWRWSRRNPVTLTLLIALFFSLIAGLVGVTWKWREAAFEKDQADAAKEEAQDKAIELAKSLQRVRAAEAQASVDAERARTEADTSKVTLDLLVGLFEMFDPTGRRAGSVTTQEILDRGTQTITVKLEGRPAIQAMLMETIAVVYRNLGLYDKAEFLLQRALTQAARTGDERGYEVVLGWKGSFLPRHEGMRIQELWRQLQSASKRLASILSAEPDPKEQSDRAQRLAYLNAERARLEMELNKRSVEFRELKQSPRRSYDQIRKSLPSGSALVDFLVYAHADPGSKEDSETISERLLAAFVVRPESPLILVNLGSMDPIKVAVNEWRKSGFGTGGQALRGLVWEKLEPHIKDADTILISPDGELEKIPFAALPGKKRGTYLLEERTFVVMPVPQLLPDLLQARKTDRPQRSSKEPSLLLIADIDYGSDHVLGKLIRLPSGEEIISIRDSFHTRFANGEVEVLRESNATEEAFRQKAPHCSYLHMSTHAFFVERSNKPTGDAVGAGLPPGISSGLVLAPSKKPVDPERDDGILTPLEVAALDLGGVELTVLGGSDSGLGEATGDESSLGFQRAFQTAGAKSVVSSVSKLSDPSAQRLMIDIYDNLWRKKMSKANALRQAQLRMLREGVERGVGTTNVPVPREYWAGWVISGDWR